MTAPIQPEHLIPAVPLRPAEMDDDYRDACVAFLRACFRDMPVAEIKRRAVAMREARANA